MNKNTRIIKISNEMHHCSSIAQTNDGRYVLTFYIGKECTDQQRVVVALFDKDKKLITHIELESKTGNPIVWNENGRIMIIYSIFTDKDVDGTELDLSSKPVLRWKYCDNYAAEVLVSDDSIKVINPTLINDAHGQLARCQPIDVNGTTLIPMYREKDPYCFIWEYNNGVKLRSSFGDVNPELKVDLESSYLGKGAAIQPSLLFVNGKLVAFCRNVCNMGNDKDSRVWMAESYDLGKTWSTLSFVGFPNHNNSIAVAFNGKLLFFIFNEDRYRKSMILFENTTRIGLNIASPLSGNRRGYSYPNYLWDSNGSFHVVHTNCKKIAWHTFDKEYLDESYKVS